MKKFVLMTSAAAMAFAGLTAGAQAQAGSTPEPEAGTRSTSDVITVTARRREESLLDAPVAVSAFTADDIRKLGIQSVDDVARFTPGLSYSAAFGRSTERPVIRGQSNVLAQVQFGVESGTAYFIDGIYYPGSVSSLDPNDIERVEVIKGPQSALYGRNTYAGAINYVTRGATEEFEANASVRAGSYGEREISGRVSGPLNDRLGFSLTAREYSYDGEWTNTVTGGTVGEEYSLNFSGTLDIEFTSNWDVRARGMYYEDDDGALPIFLQPSESNNCREGWRSNAAWPRSDSSNFNQYYCGTIRPAPVALNTDAEATRRFVAGVPGDAVSPVLLGLPFFLPPVPLQPAYSSADGTAFDGITRDGFLGAVNSTWDIGGSGYIFSVNAQGRAEEDYFGTDSDHSGVNWFFFTPPIAGLEPFLANTSRGETQDVSFEAKLESPSDRNFRWAFGAYYYDQDQKNFDINFNDTLIGSPLETLTTTNEAIFGLVEYDFSPSLTVTLEARYAEEEKTRTEFTGGAVSLEQEATFDSFTPRLTVDYVLPNGATLYGVYAQGVKPGGLNGSDGNTVGQDVYDQEESDNFEIGYKSALLGDTATLTASAFFTDASNVQVTQSVANTTGSAVNSVAVNQAGAEIWGLELAWNHAPSDFFNYALTYAYTNPEFTEGCDDFQWTLTSGGGVLDPGSSAPGTGTEFFGQTGDCNIAGNRLPLTSEHQFSAFGELRAPIGSGGWEWYAQSDVTYESSKFVQVHNLAETGDATLVGARLGVENERFALELWGRNLSDEDSIVMATRWFQVPYLASSFSPNIAPAGAASGGPRAFFGTLRKGPSVGVEARLNF